MTHASADLICPKCHAGMRSYERSGITVDQCTDCRGVFLDRGELDRLLDAEASAYASAPAPVAAPGGYRDHDRYDGGYRDHDRYDGGYRAGGYRDDDRKEGGGHRGRRRGGFLSDLFD